MWTSKGLNIRIPILIPIKGKGFMNWESTLVPTQSYFDSAAARYGKCTGLRLRGVVRFAVQGFRLHEV